MTIGATLLLHNADSRDYCWREALESVRPFVDEIVVIEADSTDSTPDTLASVTGIRVIHGKWEPVVGTGGKWLADLYNQAREALTTDYHFMIQADEVLDDVSGKLLRTYAHLGSPIECHRLNFWMDHRHLVPHGQICGHRIIRGGLKSVPVGGDAESLLAPSSIASAIRLFHYGFIRDPQAFVAKSIPTQTGYFGSYDPVLDRMKTEGREALRDFQGMKLVDYNGPHPAVAHAWLRKNGFEP
jgi:hypothetical protein